MSAMIQALSTFFGAVYVCFWSSAFYPTLVMNHRLKSSDAISLDSVFLNIIGYWSYFITITLQLFNKKVVEEYQQAYHTKPILSLIDFLYVSHCMVCVTVTLLQVLYYRIVKLKSYHEPQSSHLRLADYKYLLTVWQKVGHGTKYLMLLLVIIIAVSLHQGFYSHSLPLLTLTKVLTMVKLFINCIKYVPQLLLNYKKKSVKGFPFLSTYFDLVGGVASLCQVIIDNYMILAQVRTDKPINRLGVEIDHRLNFNMFEFITKNFAKCGLVLVGFFFDFCFLAQKKMYDKGDSFVEGKNEMDIEKSSV